jgi:propanol-preferring alcohol dehydrogenase
MHENIKTSDTSMVAARIHKYSSPLVVEDIQKPIVAGPESVLLKVGAAGLCHSDLHLINGHWQKALPLELPIIPGHEVAGWVEETGSSVPSSIRKGDLVAVFGGWGCGYCLHCKSGDEQMCENAKWPGLSEYNGGFSEFILVPSFRFLVKVDDQNTLMKPEQLAPLTDAGLTPYRAIKKVRNVLSADKFVAVIGIGGLGFYGLQYAKIFGSGATVIAMDRSESKLKMAIEAAGADYAVNISEPNNIKDKLNKITGEKGIDVFLDTVGAENTIGMSTNLLNKSGAIVLVGLFGKEVKLPLFKTVLNEHQIYGSLWGNFNELREVIELAKSGIIKHQIQKFSLSEVNEALDLLVTGNIDGRAVITP